MSRCVSAFVISEEVETDAVLVAFVSAMKEAVGRKASQIATRYGDAYRRQMLAGRYPMTLTFAFAALRFVYRIGERSEKGRGQEIVRRLLAILARPFGLAVVVADERSVKDVRTEALEANESVSRAFVAVHEAIADGKVTTNERGEVEARIAKAKAELDDLCASVNA